MKGLPEALSTNCGKNQPIFDTIRH